MILLVRKDNISLIVLVFLLSLIIYGLNMGIGESRPSAAVTGQKTVIVDAGHGGEDPGAVSDYSGVKEKDINLTIAKMLKGFLENDSYKVIMTRQEDRLVYKEGTKNIIQKRKQDLLRRKEIMDNSKADIVISIHLNKFPQNQYFGAQTFYPPNDEKSQRLAMIIQSHIRKSVDSENKREALIKKEPIIILKNHKKPTTIVECGFLSNREEEKKLITKEYQRKLALAIKSGIDEYFNHPH